MILKELTSVGSFLFLKNKYNLSIKKREELNKKMKKKLIQIVVLALVLGIMFYFALKVDAFRSIFFWNH